MVETESLEIVKSPVGGEAGSGAGVVWDPLTSQFGPEVGAPPAVFAPALFQTPTQRGWETGVEFFSRMEASAVMRWSGPANFWRSPIASIRAILALAWAMVRALDCEVLRREIELSESNPTAMMVRRIIKDKVTINAKPRRLALGRRPGEAMGKWVFMGNGYGDVLEMNFLLGSGSMGFIYLHDRPAGGEIMQRTNKR